MKLSTTAALAATLLPGALAWGSLGHITTAYLAGRFVSNTTAAHLHSLLANPDDDYLAKIASWADSIRYTKWGRFTSPFHFIDAHDDPPRDCSVDLARDCKPDGCIVTALANYSRQAVDPSLPPWRRAQAAKFVVHFVGDLHQPLHNEDVAHGGNGIHVLWRGKEVNLHRVWDSSIAEMHIGGHGKPSYAVAEAWANRLAAEIRTGRYAYVREAWLKDLDFGNAVDTAMAWARECNAVVCSHDGPEAIRGQELSGEYATKAGPVIERLVAQGGYRMAVWLDHIVDEYRKQEESSSEDL